MRVRNWRGFLPIIDAGGALGQVEGGIIGNLDGLLHGSEQTLTSLSPQSGAETLGTSDQQLHHHVSILLHTLTWKHSTGLWTYLKGEVLNRTLQNLLYFLEVSNSKI